MGKAKNVTEKKNRRKEDAAVEAIARAARRPAEEGVQPSARAQQAWEELAAVTVFPSIVVFDLDDTVWIGDIDMTSGPPFTTEGRGLPVLGQRGGHGDKVVPCADVPEVFDWLETNSIKVAVSTHTFRPTWATDVLNLMETASGTKYADLLVTPIGGDVQRKNKDVHMNAIAAQTGCQCADMVFFDDKDHNVKDAGRTGVLSHMVPNDGLTWDAFVQCLKDFEQRKTGNSVSSVAHAVVAPASSFQPVHTPGGRPQWSARPAMRPRAGDAQESQYSPELLALAAQMGLVTPNANQHSNWHRGPY